jgi:hypothetical protein
MLRIVNKTLLYFKKFKLITYKTFLKDGFFMIFLNTN